MSSEHSLLSCLLLAGALAGAACADLERGDPLPDGAAGEAGIAGREAGAAGDGATALSFARDIYPILLDGCARCHRSSGSAGNTTLLFTEDAGRDRERVVSFINPERPSDSRLLAKGAGTGHGGGAIYAVGSPEYQNIVTWITQGSLP